MNPDAENARVEEKRDGATRLLWIFLFGFFLANTARCESEWFLSKLAHQEDTEYAAGYTEEGFRRIERGMTFDEVRAFLGAPLSEYPIPHNPSETGWRYSRSPGDKSYYVRALIFHEGRVTKIYQEFYLD